MQGDILLGGIEKVRHFQLREPDGLFVRTKLDAALTVFGGVEDEVVHVRLRI